MPLRFSDLEILALIVCGLTGWLFARRVRMRSESNWPLAFYLGLLFYQKTSGEFLEPTVLYAGVVCAMMIRFEFMSPRVVKVFRFIEAICLLYVIWRCVEFVLLRHF
jgi:hypothetical protein